MLYVYLVRFFSYLSLSSILPFFSIWLFKIKLFSVGEIALLVSLLIFSNRLTSFFISPLMSKFHKKHLSIYMQILGIACVLLIYLSATLKFSSIIYWCFLVFIFGGTFSIVSICLLTIISNNIEKQQHLTGFSHINIALNLSAGLGPFIGGIVMHYFPNYFLITPALILAIALFCSFGLPLDKGKELARVSFKQLFIIGNRKMALLLIVNFLMFIAYAQFYQSFPLLAKNFVSTDWIAMAFLINGLTVALLQIPITNLMQKKQFLYLILSQIFFLVGLALLLFVTLKSYLPIILGVILISIAEIIFVPIYRALAIRWSPKSESSEVTFAKLSFTWGTGNSLAAYIGLYWIGHQYFTYPYILGAGALVIATTLLFFNKKHFHNEYK